MAFSRRWSLEYLGYECVDISRSKIPEKHSLIIRGKIRVLVFPPFNNFRRYLIHQVVETQFEILKSFSIGEGENRRTVVCFSKDHRFTPEVFSNDRLPDAPKVNSNQTAIESSGSWVQESQKKVKKPRTMPSISIYRPPATRKLEKNVNISNRETMGNSSPTKSKIKIAEDPKEINQTVKRNENDGMSVFRNAITSIRAQNKVPKCKNAENSLRKNEIESKGSKPEEVKSPNQNKQRRPDIQVYVPKGRRSVNTTNNAKKTVSPVREEKSCKRSETNGLVEEKKVETDSLDQKKASADIQSKEKRLLPSSTETKSAFKSPKSEATPEDNKNESSSPMDSNESGALEEKSEKITSGLSNRVDSENFSEEKSFQKVQVGHLNPEEDDWETMFDDTGECLDPSLLEQLTNEVGEVTLEKPKSSYSGYKTKSLDTVADEFPHVIEIYNFPPEFQIQDLMMVFSQFKNSGFEIKWVDDTHALGIFSSSAIVSEVLNFYHPFVKTRSLKEGTVLSKMKARRSAETLLPYKPRPETCSALARRLVTGALGVRLPTSRQEREAERQILTKAREKRRLEAKQKEDAWEGTFS